jgi:hypothetical protein
LVKKTKGDNEQSKVIGSGKPQIKIVEEVLEWKQDQYTHPRWGKQVA